MAHDVFICYANEDRERAQEICDSLEARGMQCWIAPRDVPPGAPYARAIIDAIRESRVLVLVFSATSSASDHVLREVECAADNNIPIIPFQIEDVLPSEEMAYYIKRVHWLAAFVPPLEQHLERLAKAVQGMLGRDVTSAAAPARPDKEAASASPPVQSAKTTTMSRNRRLLVAVGGVVALVALAFAMHGTLSLRGRDGPAPKPSTTQPMPGAKPEPPPELKPPPTPSPPKPAAPPQQVYAITDVMVTDNARRVPGEYTGVSKSELTLPYIPGQVGKRVGGSDVNEGIRGSTTTIWVKYERLPVDSDKEVLVDIEVRAWPGWYENVPEGAGWMVANGKSGGIAGGLTTGGAKADPCGLAVKYQPLEEASERILALSLSRTSGPAPRHAERSEFPDWVGLKGNEAPWKQAGGDILKGANRGIASGHPFVYLIKYVVPVPRPATRGDPA